MRSARSRIALAIVTGALAALCLPAPASAHAYLARSAPADGAVLDRAPETLTLSFTEHIEASATVLDIVDGDGRRWAVTSVSVGPNAGTDPAGAGVADAGSETPVDMVVGLPNLPPNTYHISWRTLSSDDLHTTSGTLVIGVQREVHAAAVPGPGGPGVRESAVRGVALVGTAILLGGAALTLVLAGLSRRRRRVPGERRSGPLLRVAAAGGVAAVLAVPAQLLIQVGGGGPNWPRLLWQQATGGRWLARELGLLTVLTVVLWAGRGLRPALAPLAVALGAGGALLTAAGTALLGHPIANGPLSTLIGGLHVLAAAGWAGSVAAAALALVPLLRSGTDRAVAVRHLLRAFGLLAVVCVAVLTLTGLLLTGAQVSTVDALLTTPYGILLLSKVAVAAAAGLVGLGTARLLRRRDRDVPTRRLVSEAILLTGVLVLAGTLAAAGPARGPRFPTGQIRTAPEASGQAADLVDAVTVRPNRPGSNIVSITVSDTRRPAPGPVTGVSLMLRGPDGTRKVHPVTRGADGWTVAVDDIRTAGAWTVSVTVMRDGLPPATDAHRWVVAPATQSSTPVYVSTAPLRPVLNWLAVLGSFTAFAAALFYGYRRLRRRPAPARVAPSMADGQPLPTPVSAAKFAELQRTLDEWW